MKIIENKEFEKKYQKEGFTSQRKYPNESLIQFLAGNYFSVSKSKRHKIKCLEIGCGSGANLWMISREGFQTFGLDISPTGLNLAKKMLKKWGEKAVLKLGSMHHLPYTDEFFDVIVDVVSMQHTDIKGHQKVYNEVFRTLKKGGRFFQWHLGDKSISFHKSGGKKIDSFTVDNVKNQKVPLYDNGLTCFLNSTVTKKMLKDVGFKNIVIDKVTRTYNGTKDKIEYLAVRAEKKDEK